MREAQSMSLEKITQELVEKLQPLTFSAPVTHVYNPLIYARAPHLQYLETYGKKTPREVLLIGMNPGPFGMAQTGVPFGEINLVRDWLGIEAPVQKPDNEHPKRPIVGFACARSEVSGARLWGFAKARFTKPKHFFTKFFVANYCPLVFMDAGGRNVTPDKLAKEERDAMLEICDASLKQVIGYFDPRYVIGVGAFVEKRLQKIVSTKKIKVGRITHPSPASPVANRGWQKIAMTELQALGITV
jgi:single-strand selective monofunctional uracil DNA glycosylase